MGAAGRDFHDFNMVFRDRDDVEVVAFTRFPKQNLGEAESSRIPRYPPELAGNGYPDGIDIEPEGSLEEVVRSRDVDQVVFSYSDVSHQHVMHAASRAEAAGADFRLIGPDSMMVGLDAPVLAVDAVRTGCGKSQASRGFAAAFKERGLTVRIVREPMPYGDLVERSVTRFESYQDLDEANVTIEEREEYEQHIDEGHVVYAGVDYEEIAREVEKEADVVVWDGGNNELPFFEPDVHVVLTDPLRAGDERRYHPGEVNLRRADCVIVNKENSATGSEIETVVGNVEETNPEADTVHADSVVTVANPNRVKDARVLVVEDGPTLTHGDTSFGAGAVAAEKFDASEKVNPRDVAVGSIRDVFEKYPHLERCLPAMGYSEKQINELEETIRNVDCDVVLSGTPHDLSEQVEVDTPIERVRYDIELKDTSFENLVDKYSAKLGI